jgi:hypothetical protein
MFGKFLNAFNCVRPDVDASLGPLPVRENNRKQNITGVVRGLVAMDQGFVKIKN